LDTCEWPSCQSPGTHKVEVRFPDLPGETWLVCRLHDHTLKGQAVRSRPKKSPVVERAVQNVVRCDSCERVLEERSDAALGERRPCPHCGSSVRRIEVQVFEALTVHEKVGVKVKRSGKGGWILNTTSGDEYTNDLEAWGKRALTTDRERNVYREVIELWDGTRIESTARLSDHHD